MDNSVDSIINLINLTVANSYAINIWVPSAGEDIRFKPLSISQQKNLINTSITQDIYNTKFTKVFYNILKDNYLSNDILSFELLTTLDKYIIAIALRANINDIYQNISLSKVIETIQASNFELFTSKVFGEGNIELHCALPVLKSEYDCESERETPQTENISEQIQHIISETVINELTKFSVKAKLEGKDINLSAFLFNERKQILNQIPAFILEQALNYILSCKQQIEKLLSFNNSEETQSIIQLDGSFFATS